MPEYLAPGVYVTEIASNARPIEGVSTSTTGQIGSEAVTQLQRLASSAPEWTEHNDHDPGIALLELCAFLTESLLYRKGSLPERAAEHAARLAAAGLTLAATCAQPRGSVLRKVRFFEGRMLSADDFRTEQDYTRR